MMRQRTAFFLGVMLTIASTAHAQAANPISSHLKGQWTNIRDLLTRMAAAMPDEHYRFKPTQEMQDFGQRMGHVFTANLRFCASAKGEQKSLPVSAAPTRAEIQTILQESNAYCDGVFNTLTDADAMTMVAGGRGGPRQKFAILESGVLEHAQESYGYMAPYLRLKGVVPPSSSRNE